MKGNGPVHAPQSSDEPMRRWLPQRIAADVALRQPSP